MDAKFEQAIRERAYGIWQASGMVDGDATAHWLMAERTLRAETGAVTKPAKVASKAAKPVVRKAAAKPIAAAAKTAKTPAAGSKAARPSMAVMEAGA